jgi:hypothetical protein
MSLEGLGRKRHLIVAAIIATAFFVFLSLAAIDSPGFDQEPAGGAEDFDRLADAIFTDHVLALEALGILLTAAMIGAMVIARPLGSTPANYPTRRTQKELAEIQYISDVDRNMSDSVFPTTPVNDGAPNSEDEEE